jgi:hypothetical protein
MDDFTPGTRITFHYTSSRSGIARQRDVVVSEVWESKKGTRILAYPLDSESGRDGVRTFTPSAMENVKVLGTVDLDTLS